MKSTFRSFLSFLLCDWVATTGAVIVSTTAVVFLIYAFESFSNPYYGILLFVLLPGLFLFGLALIPLGVWRRSRRPGGLTRISEEATGARAQRVLTLIALLSLVNVAIISAATYQSVRYMDSNAFCGTVCHTVMSPQFTAYQDSPHARVDCVSCHIGPGAQSFVHYKVAGLRQLFRVTTNTYHKPVLPALTSLRPSRDTCEQCHSPQNLTRQDKLRVIRHYDEDENNTEKTTVLMMRTATKIHRAHVGRNIEYTSSDPLHQEIPWVSVDGIEYKTGEPSGVRRKMDCLDCHNRQAHDFEMPAPAVDKALESGSLDRKIPFAKRDALLALAGKTPLDASPVAVKKIYARNIWPEMSISWGAYPNNIGHDAFPGCFRCHDDSHKSAAGKTISQDCATCHEVLAVSEENPEILKQLGIASTSRK